MENKTVLIIDPIHSANYLSKKLKENNVRSVALFSDMSNITEFNRPGKHLFDRQIHIKEENLDEIILKIDEPIDFVLNGCDQHLSLCEKIAKIITPCQANNPENTQIRESKFHQQEAMKKSGYSNIKQALIKRKEPDYSILSDFHYPVFAKPVNGGGSIGIFKASNLLELAEEIEKAPVMVNFDPIEYYLIQEFVEGREIIIDAFSYEGNHTFSHVFTYQKKDIKNAPVYRTIETLDDSELIEKAIAFATNVLNICEYQNGFSHIELFYTEEGDFKLIELNPRISGASGLPNMMAEVVGLKPQDRLLVEYLKSGIAESSDFKRTNGFAKALLMYGNEEINFSPYESYQSHIIINNTIYNEERAPDLTDLRKIVFVYNVSKDTLERDAYSILSMDTY